MTPPNSKEIPGFDGFYRADIFGQIWSCRVNGRILNRRGPWKKLKATGDKGYFVIDLKRNGKGIGRSLHQVILETFVGPKPPGKQTRHLDSNPANNRLSNLKWGTAVENYSDRIPIGRGTQGEKNGRAKLTWEKVRRIKELYSNPHIKSRRREKGLHTLHSLAEMFRVDFTQIHNIVRGLQWKE